MQKTCAQSLGQEDPLDDEMANHSSILVWRFPMERGAWRATVLGVTIVRDNLVTKRLPLDLYQIGDL